MQGAEFTLRNIRQSVHKSVPALLIVSIDLQHEQLHIEFYGTVKPVHTLLGLGNIFLNKCCLWFSLNPTQQYSIGIKDGYSEQR